MNYARQSGKLVLDYQAPDALADACNSFYDQVWEAEQKINKNLDTTIMKAKYVWVALLALTFFGCDDNTGTIGWDMLPDSDQNINGRYTTYELTTNSDLSGPVLPKPA